MSVVSCRVVSCSRSRDRGGCLAREARSLPLSKAPQPRPLPPRAAALSWLCSAPLHPLPRHDDRILAGPLIGTRSQGTTAALVLFAPGLHVRRPSTRPLQRRRKRACNPPTQQMGVLYRDGARRAPRDMLISDDGARRHGEPCPVQGQPSRL